MSDAVASQGETTPSNTNSTSEAPAQTEASEAPQMPDLGLSIEQAQQFKNMLENHGGADKVLEKMKAAITTRKADAPAEPAPAPVVENTTPEPQPQAPVQPVQPAKGFVTPQEIMAGLYNEKIASTPEYAGIKDDILSGAYLKEMAGMGMTPVDAAGNLNDRVIRQYLDLKAKTVPAPAPSTPMTNTPLKQYTEVEGDITSYEQALAIRKEGSGHPRYADAEQVIKNHFKPSQPEQK